MSARPRLNLRFMPPESSAGLACVFDCNAANSSNRGTRSSITGFGNPK